MSPLKVNIYISIVQQPKLCNDTLRQIGTINPPRLILKRRLQKIDLYLFQLNQIIDNHLMAKLPRLLMVLIYLLSIASWSDERQDIEVLSYYEVPPFKVSEGEGLSFELVAMLNAAAPKGVSFNLKHRPRNRINQALKFQEPVIVLLVNPAWFGDKTKTRYYWSDSLFEDGNDVVSRVLDPIEYQGVESLKGKRMGALLGRKYGPVDKAVAAGDIIREDVNDLGRNLLKLRAGHIDFTILSRTWSGYLIRSQNMQGVFKRSAFKDFKRHLLISRKLKSQLPFLNNWVRSLAKNAQWQQLLKKYGITK